MVMPDLWYRAVQSLRMACSASCGSTLTSACSKCKMVKKQLRSHLELQLGQELLERDARCRVQHSPVP